MKDNALPIQSFLEENEAGGIILDIVDGHHNDDKITAR
jgi:hypothetical protein